MMNQRTKCISFVSDIKIVIETTSGEWGGAERRAELMKGAAGMGRADGMEFGRWEPPLSVRGKGCEWQGAAAKGAPYVASTTAA